MGAEQIRAYQREIFTDSLRDCIDKAVDENIKAELIDMLKRVSRDS